MTNKDPWEFYDRTEDCYVNIINSKKKRRGLKEANNENVTLTELPIFQAIKSLSKSNILIQRQYDILTEDIFRRLLPVMAKL